MIKEQIPTDLLQSITTQQAWHYMVLPFERQGDQLELYIADGQNELGTAEELEVLLGCSIQLKAVEGELLRREIAKYYRRPNDQRTQSQNLNFQSEQAKDFLPQLLREAKQLGSSDIHIEPFEESSRIRIRIDGKLIERYVLEKAEYPSLVNKVKIQANLDIAEKRLPQDGRINLRLEDNSQLDVRVSVLPTLHGEKIVLRLLSNDATNIDLNILGFNEQDLDNYLEGVKRPNGIVLISGPTGSGKTTTLYATLKLLNQSTTNIVTIEDPIEYTLEGINQVQLKEQIGLDFPSAMRTFLRQDPDIIMVGEIRDKATASMAIRASLTGHLVLSTVHTNSAWGIVARMIDMGIPAYLLADTLNTAVAQRLVRLLCPHCKTSVPFEAHQLPKRYVLPRPLKEVAAAKGCEHCFYTGYKGRKAVYEVIPIDLELSRHIKDEDLNVGDLLEERGVSSLAENAFALLEAGLTTTTEVYPILASGA
ncbi:MAG: GspE/PulE family protein [Bacteroidota bacterium]